MRIHTKLLLTTLAIAVALPAAAGTPISQVHPLDARGRPASPACHAAQSPSENAPCGAF